MTKGAAKDAVAAIQRAQLPAAQASPVEQALIAALATRYADPQPADRAPLDLAYAAAMREVFARFPQDADVAALTAEALMDLSRQLASARAEARGLVCRPGAAVGASVRLARSGRCRRGRLGRDRGRCRDEHNGHGRLEGRIAERDLPLAREVDRFAERTC